ncbi:hypothetical protein A2U01_0058349, partial [Trifolium medium]|nr:hypothetical protein [Trifolium medium]
MHARNDVVFGKIIAKLEILLQLSSHGATNSVKAHHASESLNVVMPNRDEFLPSVEQIKIPSPCEQSLLVEVVTPASDLIEDVLDLSATAKHDDNKFQPYELITEGRKFS